MPEIPIIVPLIVVGLAIGSILKSKNPKISKKKLGSASLVAGLLNSIYACLIYSLVPTQIAAGAGGVSQGGPAMPIGLASTSVVSFTAASFLAGFLLVLLVLGVAAAYARVGKREEIEEAAEVASEEGAALAPN